MRDETNNQGVNPLGETPPKGAQSPKERHLTATGNTPPKRESIFLTVAPPAYAGAPVSPDLLGAYVRRNHPLPWSASEIIQPATAKCHHKTRTVVITDANGRRVWWTKHVVTAICNIVNANAAE